MNEAILFAIKTLSKNIKDDINSANALVKEFADVQALMEAKIVSQENMEFYENLRDIYVRVHFGNNVILPFYIDNNIATCLKVSNERKNTQRKFLNLTELKSLFKMEKKNTIYDVQKYIKDVFGTELKIEEEETTYFKVKKASISEAVSVLRGTAWEASLKRFIGEAEEIIGNPERLAGDSKLIKRAKRIVSIMSMMETKQQAILASTEIVPNNFIEQAKRKTKKFNPDEVKSFLSTLEKTDKTQYELLTKVDNKKISTKMVGIFHIDELIDISPDLQSILDLELNNKVNYKVKLLKEGRLNERMEKEEIHQEEFIEDFNEPVELSDEDLESESYSPSF